MANDETVSTMPIDRILSVKNARAWVSNGSRMKILGAVLELPAKEHCQFSPLTSKLGQIGQIGIAV